MRTLSWMKPRLPALLPLLCLAACFGRSPNGEFRIDGNVPGPGPEFSTALFQVVDLRMKPGNKVDPIDNGKVFEAAIEEISRAQKSIHLVTFIWADGEVSNRMIDAMTARAGAGVQCRILVDAVGSLALGDIQGRLEQGGCEVHKLRPIPGQDNAARVHRKIIVIDGKVGFTGGFGIDDKWDGDGLHDEPKPQWRDSNLRVRGPAVADMQRAFSENWQEVTGQLLPGDAFPPPEDAGTAQAAFMASTAHAIATNNDRLTQLLIQAARKRLWISNAYFVPSTPIMELLTRKARAGVDVRVMAAGDKTDIKPYLPNQRARMDQLARDGVKAYEYEPTMMHGKTMIVDDSLVAIGSCNLDALSLNKMDEGALVVEDRALADEESRRFLEDLTHSKQRIPDDLPAPIKKTAAR